MANQEHRVFLKVLTKKGWSNQAIYDEMRNAFQGNCPCESTLKKWIREFRCGREDTDNRTQRDSVLQIDYSRMLDPIRRTVAQNRKISVADLAAKFKVSVGTMDNILKEMLGMKKLTPKKVPHQLSNEQKRVRVGRSECALSLYNKNTKDFFDYIFTMDETWRSIYEPESRTEAMEWVNDPSELSQRPTSERRNAKIMASVYWSCAGILRIFWLAEGTTITGQLYREQLREIDSLVRAGKRRKPLFLQDNARPHTATQTKALIKELGWVMIEHPPYSPDLAPSDYFLFSHLKRHMRGKVFASIEAIKVAVTDFFSSKPSAWYRQGFEALPLRWQKCIAAEGNYFN